MTATQNLHPTTEALLRLTALVEALPELSPEEKDRAATRALLNRARSRNARRPFKPGQQTR